MDVTAFILVALLIAGLAGLVSWQHHKRLRAAYEVYVASDPTLQATERPCGLDPSSWHRFAGIDAGDRRRGLRWGVEGPMAASVGGVEVGVHVAAFEWWYEERSTSGSGKSRSTTYSKRRLPVVVARLPVELPVDLTVGPKSLWRRIGIGRRGQEVESQEFNRAFHVESSDERLTLKLLDANLQAVLPGDFARRTLTVSGPWVVLTGDPRTSDRQRPGPIGKLPGLRADLVHLIGQVPAAFWRATGAAPGGDVDE